MVKVAAIILLLSFSSSLAQVDLTLLRDINTGVASPLLPDMIVAALHEKTIFFRHDNAEGIQVWATAGTEASTTKIFLLGQVSTVFGQKALPENFTIVGNNLYFTSNLHLFVTDGTSSGTRLVFKGVDDIYGLSNLNGNLIFHVDYSPTDQLWRTDGTQAGTYMLGSGMGPSAAFNGNVYFANPGSGGGLELWKSDGTSGGQLLKEIMAGTSGSNPGNFVASGSRLFFLATDNINGRELWQSDGTEAGTTMVKDISPGNSWSTISNMVDVSGSLFFLVQGFPPKIWKSDGTSANTLIVETFVNNDLITNLTVSNGKLFFLKDYLGITGEELWVTDGLPSNAQLVQQLSSEPNGSVVLSDRIITVGSEVHFIIDDGSEGEIWESDGTAAGTQPYLTSQDLSAQGIGKLQGLQAHGDRFSFLYNDEGKNLNVWLSDGTVTGTRRVSSFEAYGAGSISNGEGEVFDGHFYFIANDGVHGNELWRTNGLVTELFFDCYPGEPSGFGYPSPKIMVAGDLLFFAANDGIHDTELWKTNGTLAGTSLVKDITPNPDNLVYITLLGTHQDKVVFSTNDGVHGVEPWVSDGSEPGTQMLADISTGVSSSYPTLQAGSLNDHFIFSTGDNSLWKSDGTPAGTTLLQVLGSVPTTLYADNDILFLAKNQYQGSTVNELHAGDGTLSGTQLIKQFQVAPNEYNAIFGFTRFNGYTYFTAKDNTSGFSVWRTDGTASGTSLYLDPIPGYQYYGGPILFRVVGNSLFIISVTFSGLDGTEIEVWVTDGTGPSSRLSVFPFHNLILDGPWLSFKEQLIFQGYDPMHGVELWSSDGSVAGTKILRDIVEGPQSSHSILMVTNTDDFYLLTSGDGVNPQVWKSDGTACRTQQMTSEPGIIYHFRSFDDNGMVVFENHPQFGPELFFYDKLAEPPFLCNQQIVFEPADKPLSDGSVTLVATATSGLPVTLTPNNARVSISGATATFLSAGKASVKAEQLGDSYFSSISVDKEFCINPDKPTVTAEFGSTGGFLIKSSSTEENEWYFNGSPMNEVSSELNVTATGQYHVRVVIDGCYSPDSEIVTLPDDAIVTAVAEKHRRSYFPNPVIDYLEITGAVGSPFELLDATGRVSMTGWIVENKRLDLRGLRPGIYLVTVELQSELWRFKIAKN